MTDFVHLQLHSAYSILHGPRSIAELVHSAAQAGYDTLAITDIDSLYGVHAFAEACTEHHITPIFGTELTDGHGGRAVLLAQSAAGFANLCCLVTQRKQANFNLRQALVLHQQGVIVLSDTPALLEHWHGTINQLYALIFPWSHLAARSAHRLAIPLVVTCQACFLDPADRETQRVLKAIASQKALSSISDDDCSHPGARLLSLEEALQSFHNVPQALANTRTIAESINFHAIFAGWIFPQWESPTNSLPTSEVLRQRVLHGAMDRYGEIGDGTLARIDYELEIINSKDFTDYFLIVADIVSIASRTCGRGSGAASIVAYCLGITNVDPIRHNLYFERFLNRERTDPPDIDIDFAWDERDGIIARVMENYGRRRCARVANHLHFQPRSAIREVARVFGIPESEISAWERGHFHDNGTASDDPVWQEIRRIAKQLTGLPRGLSVHSGGIVLSPGDLCRHAPMEQAPSASIIAWEKEGTEAAGLVKIDLLGNRSLAVIRDALANLAEQGTVINPHEWNTIDDPATQALLARGDSMGVFYAESPAMRQLQQKTGAGDFEHLVIHSSIIRPAANRFINEYVRRLKGGSFQHLHPRLETMLAETYGILCYQEDISKAGIALAGFSEGDADQLRKVVSKKAGKRLLVFKEKFYQGCQSNGIASPTIDAVWEMILSFDGYSFCKPHSASYAMVSFQSAWLKAHHGSEFMAAVLSNQGGYYTACAYISEARRMGVSIAGPCVNHSRLRYHAEAGHLRVGLMAIAGLSATMMEALLTERAQRGKYTSLSDFMRRITLGRDEAAALAMAGALASLAPDIDRYEQLRTLLTNRPASSASTCREQLELIIQSPATLPCKPKQATGTRQATLHAEMNVLGFLIQHHPLVLYAKALQDKTRVLAKDLPKHSGSCIRVAGWPVTRKEVATKQGDAMEFFTFEDETAIYETVLFPEAYTRFARQLYAHRPFWVQGTVHNDLGAFCLHVNHVEAMAL